ncbi:MAG TPA: lasso peptide biosynthesis B2 protein, partial [Verrucomicrobiae bacterium]|nr:lasso peptide biosynthesis B2 protein [Verrucomicrobiae bacterium]
WSERYSRLALGAVSSSPRLTRLRRSLARATDLKFSEWVEIARAGLLLTRARWALAREPLPEVVRWATCGTDHGQGDAVETREIVFDSEKAVRRAARFHLVEMKCLPRALALTKMLAARGIAVDLKLGVRREDGDFAGHAWVEWNGEAVNESAPVTASYAPLDHSLDRGAESFDVASA